MSNLKQKFGKFAMSKAQAKTVRAGASWTCYNSSGQAIGTRTTKASAFAMCNAAIDNAAYGYGSGCAECRENLCPEHEGGL
jgi:hypothetical protein